MEQIIEIYNDISENTFLMASFLVVILLLTWFVGKVIFLRVARRLLPLFTNLSDDELIDGIARKIASIVAVTLVLYINQMLPSLSDEVNITFKTICWALIIINVAALVNDGLDVFIIRQSKKILHRNNSIKGYIEIAKIIVWIISFILIIALMTEQSPIIIISSFGAIAAVLMFVFQHTLLSFVANILVSNGKVLKLYDWIELPSSNISGEVIDIALHTITVRNWDNTISRIPTKDFLTEKYTNWQPMFSSGGRRIKRSFYIDQSSISFATEDLFNELKNTPPLRQSIESMLEARGEIGDVNEWMINNGVTNLQLFRKYILNWIKLRGDVRTDMYLVIRTMPPTPNGLPVEIYCFTRSTTWVDYEEVQSEIFEYVNASANYFKLRIYQHPAGSDLANLKYQ
ncbi:MULTISPECIES: mechanosensitive ion channel family protein [Providencia]|uniref:Mechanosensitive ion channel family protein n=1 Tax=Providencia huaxiensis TaxID=2027290 RepID=A0ABU2J2T3_9GAMM|nr:MULTISPECIES: mechanosensitive ion channel domain-containing protein [Providencia]AXH63741.1 mechanosensitive ion channel [Providencia huaxiensis]MBN6360739.1 mechanosensitive ion channel [Providencia huaxiensis]MBZ3681859.1 mechanosensitive ion channel [Providencia rettgeri]MCD2527686.1 mechanosensitive ion channel family protein [Providencia huaxiensis]MDT0135352.1 mechanosensitive ion channel family protein [Providencia huaxiensis]